MKTFRVHRHIRQEVEIVGMKLVPAIIFAVLTAITLLLFLSLVGICLVPVYFFIAKAIGNVKIEFESLPDKINN